MDSYSVEVHLSKQADGLWRARVPHLQGCFVDGGSLKDVLRDIQDVAAMFIDIHLEQGNLPRDVDERAPEGTTLRLPVILSDHTFRRPGKALVRRNPQPQLSGRWSTLTAAQTDALRL